MHPDYGYRLQNGSHPSWNAPDGGGTSYQPGTAEAPESTSHTIWRNEQLRAPGDFAPFPNNPAHISQRPQINHPFVFGQQRNDSLWPQPQQPLRALSYGNIEDLSGQGPAFSGAFIAQPTPMRYAPPPLNTQNSSLMLQEPAPHSAPVRSQHQPFSQPHPFVIQQSENSSASNTSLVSHQPYSGNWYPDPSSFEPLEEEPENYGLPRQQRPG